MLLHPDAQHRAQAEIDQVIGSERLPDWVDRPSLPYTECVMYEAMRYLLSFTRILLQLGLNFRTPDGARQGL